MGSFIQGYKHEVFTEDETCCDRYSLRDELCNLYTRRSNRLGFHKIFWFTTRKCDLSLRWKDEDFLKVLFSIFFFFLRWLLRLVNIVNGDKLIHISNILKFLCGILFLHVFIFIINVISIYIHLWLRSQHLLHNTFFSH